MINAESKSQHCKARPVSGDVNGQHRKVRSGRCHSRNGNSCTIYEGSYSSDKVRTIIYMRRFDARKISNKGSTLAAAVSCTLGNDILHDSNSLD